MSIKLIINNTLYDELKIVIKGDMDGNGVVTATDYAMLKRRLLNEITVDYIVARSADFDDNGKLLANDYAQLKNYLLNTIPTLNKPKE